MRELLLRLYPKIRRSIRLCAILGSTAFLFPSLALEFHVSPSGNDANTGSSASPFRTLEKARDTIRTIPTLPAGGVTVYLHGGTYALAQPFTLTAPDSGETGKPITYKSFPGETARLSGGILLDQFSPVTNPAILSRLDPAVRSHVLQTDLGARGLTDFGPVNAGGAELFSQDKPMQSARWPNTGFVKIDSVVNFEGGIFRYQGDRPSRWLAENEPWLDGYWFNDWFQERRRIDTINTANKTINLEEPRATYGYRAGQWYFAFNMLCELDTVGEWYLDRVSRILYFWPPSVPAATLSLCSTLVKIDGASHITLQGLVMEESRKTAIVVNNSSDIQIDGCAIRNTGGTGINVLYGKKNLIRNSEIAYNGDFGINLWGGDRFKLVPAEHKIENNNIHHFSRINRTTKPGIYLGGVGNVVAHNHIHDAPHMGIQFNGNDHIIEYNRFDNLVYESNDAGAVYNGRDWTQRGTVIRYNYFENIRGRNNLGAMAVYLDDFLSGNTIYGNIFNNVYYGVMIGGGRDNIVENNIFVDVVAGVRIDQRGITGGKYFIDTTAANANKLLYTLLARYKYDQPPYSTRYTHLANILADEPGKAKYNRIVQNVFYKASEWIRFAPDSLGAVITNSSNASPIVLTLSSRYSPKSTQNVRVRFVAGNTAANGTWTTAQTAGDLTHITLSGSQGNGAYTSGGVVYNDYITIDSCLTYGDPLFADYSAGNFRFKQTSPVWALGFRDLPYDRMGITGSASIAGDRFLPKASTEFSVRSIRFSSAGARLSIDLEVRNPIGNLNMEIFDVAGRLVNRTTFKKVEPGLQVLTMTVPKHGTTAIPAGFYVSRISTSTIRQVKKLALIP